MKHATLIRMPDSLAGIGVAQIERDTMKVEVLSGGIFHHLPSGLYFDADPCIGLRDTIAGQVFNGQAWEVCDCVRVDGEVAVAVEKVRRNDLNGWCCLTDHFFTAAEAMEAAAQLV